MLTCITNIKLPECPDLCEILDMDKEDMEEELDKIEQKFATVTGGVVRGCVGALDGLCIKIKRPSKGTKEGQVANPAAYFTRKGFFALPLQCIADKWGMIRYVSITQPGSSHDSVSWTCSKLARRIRDGDLDQRYFIVGDDAYAASEQMITPYPGRGLNSRKDGFNFYQSSLRIKIVSQR